MKYTSINVLTVTLVTIILAACASNVRPLMPTPSVYLMSGGRPVFDPTKTAQLEPEIDLFYITDRAPLKDPESKLPYGQERDKAIAFGSARVRIAPALSGEALAAQSRLESRTRELTLEMGPIRELGRFPQEPYDLKPLPSGDLVRDPGDMQVHEFAKQRLLDEIQRRLAESPKKEIILYVHGFNETFATAAYTTAELCHFLGRESVCAFYTWPSSSTGNFLISYTSTVESAQYAVTHLKKAIRVLARAPGVERVQLLAHSRGTAVLMSAIRELMIESAAAGIDPVDEFHVDNVVLFSPDIDIDIAAQQLTVFSSDPELITAVPNRRIPRWGKGRLTIYASPEDRALLISSILFRSRRRLGALSREDLSPQGQQFIAKMGGIDLIVYRGERTDIFGHSYFTTNPRVSSDLIQMLRYGKKIGEPGRELVSTGLVSWTFPGEAVRNAR
jgi:esterase/lipase superfamily enzyme